MDLNRFFKMQIDASICLFYQNWFQVDEIFEFSTLFVKVWIKCTYVFSTFNIFLKIKYIKQVMEKKICLKTKFNKCIFIKVNNYDHLKSFKHVLTTILAMYLTNFQKVK